MEITQVRVFPVHEEKLKAFASIVLDNCFVVCDIKIIEGGNGLFVSMPSKRRKNGTFRDIAHPLNSETRRKFEETIISKYRETLGNAMDEDAARPVRRIAGEAAAPSEAGAASEPETDADGR